MIARLLVVGLMVSVACTGASPPRKVDTSAVGGQLERIPAAAGEDTVYRRRLNDLLVRARKVPTDSLVRLYVALPNTPEPSRHMIRQAIMCQYAILLAKYGQAAVGRAKGWVADSLERRGLKWNRIQDLVDDGPGPDLEISDQACGRIPDSDLPDSLVFEPQPPP